MLDRSGGWWGRWVLVVLVGGGRPIVKVAVTDRGVWLNMCQSSKQNWKLPLLAFREVQEQYLNSKHC